MAIKVNMKAKSVPITINENMFETEFGVVTLKFDCGTYDISEKAITCTFPLTAKETATLAVENGIIKLPITTDLVKAGINEFQLNFRKQNFHELSPKFLWYILPSSKVLTEISEGTLDILSQLIASANDISLNTAKSVDAKESSALSETRAKTSEDNAKTSEDNAKASETASKASEEKALISEQNAKTSETNSKTSEDNAKASEDKALISEGKAKTSEVNAKVSETNAKTSEVNAKSSETVTVQAMMDYLAMIGKNIATLDASGFLTASQLPPLAINDTFPVASVAEITLLTAQRGDVAIVVKDDVVTDSYLLASDDPTNLANWKKLGISYVAEAGHAVQADTAIDSNMINGHRLVAMTPEQYANAVLDDDTYYFVSGV